MNIAQIIPRFSDDLSVVADGGETIQIYQPDSGRVIVVDNCVAQPIKENKAPSDSPEGATALERIWNAPLKGDHAGAPLQAVINDVIIDVRDQQWRIASIERKERIGRIVFKTQRIDLSPRLDVWIDIVTPIYQTDENGAPCLQKYRNDATGVPCRIIRVPVSSHRQLTDVPEERIEIVFADPSVRIDAKQRLRLADGSIYKPTDLFPITQARPVLRLIVQKEVV